MKDESHETLEAFEFETEPELVIRLERKPARFDMPTTLQNQARQDNHQQIVRDLRWRP